MNRYERASERVKFYDERINTIDWPEPGELMEIVERAKDGDDEAFCICLDLLRHGKHDSGKERAILARHFMPIIRNAQSQESA